MLNVSFAMKIKFKSIQRMQTRKKVRKRQLVRFVAFTEICKINKIQTRLLHKFNYQYQFYFSFQ